MGMISTYARRVGADSGRNAENAVAGIKKDFSGHKPAQVVFFAGASYDHDRLAALMRDAFPDALTFGCSTSGEIANGVMLNDSVAAMAFEDDVFESFRIGVVRRLGEDGRPVDPRVATDHVLDGFEHEMGRPLMDLDFSQYVGLAIADGRQYFPEPVLDRVGERTNVIFIGGLAGDDGRFVDTPVYHDGRALRDAMLLMLAKPRGRFGLVKTQGLKVSDRVFTVTRANEAERRVDEFDGRPAAMVLSEAIQVPVELMDLRGTFARWPFGLMVNGEPLLRVALEVLPGGGLQFAHAVGEGMRLVLSTPDDIVSTTASALEEARERLGGISGILHFNCMSRHHTLAERHELKDFGDLFRGFPNAGFSSHGEIYVAIANQTSTMLVFA